MVDGLYRVREAAVVRNRYSSGRKLSRAEVDEDMDLDAGPLPESLLNLAAARVRLGNDESLLCDLARFFLEDSPSLLARLFEALGCDDIETAERSAHSLKGLASNFDALAAVAIAQRLEDAIRRRDTPVTANLASELQGEIQRVAQALHTDLLGRGRPDGPDDC